MSAVSKTPQNSPNKIQTHTRIHAFCPKYVFLWDENEWTNTSWTHKTLDGQLVAEIQTSAYLIGFFFFSLSNVCFFVVVLLNMSLFPCATQNWSLVQRSLNSTWSHYIFCLATSSSMKWTIRRGKEIRVRMFINAAMRYQPVFMILFWFENVLFNEWNTH